MVLGVYLVWVFASVVFLFEDIDHCSHVIIRMCIFVRSLQSTSLLVVS